MASASELGGIRTLDVEVKKTQGRLDFKRGLMNVLEALGRAEHARYPYSEDGLVPMGEPFSAASLTLEKDQGGQKPNKKETETRTRMTYSEDMTDQEKEAFRAL